MPTRTRAAVNRPPLMAGQVPRADSRPAPEAERFAEALETDTAKAAAAVREHRNPDWGRVEEALRAWEDAAAGMGARSCGARRNCIFWEGSWGPSVSVGPGMIGA